MPASRFAASGSPPNRASVAALSAYAIFDQSGTLSSITNSGTISAVATTLKNNAQIAIAADLALNTTGVTFTNTGTVLGAIIFGTCAYAVVVLLFRRALPLGKYAA